MTRMITSNAARRSGPLTYDLLRPKYTTSWYDITPTINSMMFARVPRGRVDYAQFSVIGRPMSGKTWLLSYLAGVAHEAYGDRMNLVYTDNILVAADLMDERPLQLIIIDDASGGASSRQSGRNVDSIQAMNTLRHKLEDLQEQRGAEWRGGRVVFGLAWQRKNDLDRAMRQADFQFYKTAPLNMDERQELEELIGPRYMNKLLSINRMIIEGSQEIKATSIGLIPAMGVAGGGVGLYTTERSRMYSMPRMVEADAYYTEQEARKRAVEEQKVLSSGEQAQAVDVSQTASKPQAKGKKENSPPMRARVRVSATTVVALRNTGMTYREIAAELGVSPSTVQSKLREAEALN